MQLQIFSDWTNFTFLNVFLDMKGRQRSCVISLELKARFSWWQEDLEQIHSKNPFLHVLLTKHSQIKAQLCVEPTQPEQNRKQLAVHTDTRRSKPVKAPTHLVSATVNAFVRISSYKGVGLTDGSTWKKRFTCLFVLFCCFGFVTYSYKKEGPPFLNF